MNKRMIIKIITIVVLFISILLVNYYDVNINNKNSSNYGENVIEGLKFEKIDSMYDPNEGSYLTVKITNVSNKIITIDGIKVISRDIDKNILGTIEAKLYVELDEGESFDYLFYTSDNIIVGNDSFGYVPNILD